MIGLAAYEPLVLNKYVNVDNAYGAQCWDLIGHFTDWLGVPRINTWGGVYGGWAAAMWDQYNVNGASKYWDKISPNQPAQQGDIVIWFPTPGIYPASHVAIVVEDAGANLWTLSQNSSPSLPGNPYPNQSTGPTIKQLLPKTGLAGYLRRKTASVQSISALADQVLAGKHGTGEARRIALGTNYDAVQAEINRRAAAPKPKPKTVNQLAQEVLQGKHGTGAARKSSLGAKYAQVQAEVDRILAAKAKPLPKTVNQLADEVLQGKHGSGDARKKSLGSKYNAVQAEINRRLSK